MNNIYIFIFYVSLIIVFFIKLINLVIRALKVNIFLINEIVLFYISLGSLFIRIELESRSKI